MRTPLDGFHTALVNLLDERRRAEEKARRRRRTGLTEATTRVGMRVVFRLPPNLRGDRVWSDVKRYDGCHGTITTVQQTFGQGSSDWVEVLLDGDQAGTPWNLPPHFLDLEDPPPSTTSIEEIERWLAS